MEARRRVVVAACRRTAETPGGVDGTSMPAATRIVSNRSPSIGSVETSMPSDERTGPPCSDTMRRS